MPGLLKQLQKSKSSLISGIDTVLIRPQADDQPSPMREGIEDLADKVEGTAIQAERLLDELMAEAATAAKSGSYPKADAELAGSTVIGDVATGDMATKSSLRIVRRRGQSTQSQVRTLKRDEVQPWWLSEQKRLSQQVEALILHAERDLAKIYGVDRDEPLPRSETPPYEDAIRTAISAAAELVKEDFAVLKKDRDLAQREISAILFGKGPLEPLFQDTSVSDIFVDSHRVVKAVRKGQILETPFFFRSNDEYRLFVAAMLSGVGCALSSSSPIANCVLEDQWKSRLNALHPSLIDGLEPKVCIRVPRMQHVSFFDLLQAKVLPATVASWLAEVIGAREANILVVGPNGAGKTVMSTALLSAVHSHERVIVVENVPEIAVPTGHIEKLVARPAGTDGTRGVSLSDLIRTALLRSPHRIALGEMRDDEARMFLRVLETGIEGSLGSIHADSAIDGLWRLVDLIAATETSPLESIVRRISRSVHIVVAMRKVDNGPCLSEIVEVHAGERGDFSLVPIVKFEGVVDGKRQWRLLTESSHWIDRVREKGFALTPGPALVAASGSDLENASVNQSREGKD